MGKIFAILAAGAVAAGGAAYAVMHHLDPYAAEHGGCPLARMAGCSATVTESGTVECPANTDVITSSPCCALAPAPTAAVRAVCCESDATCSPALAAVVGPAGAMR